MSTEIYYCKPGDSPDVTNRLAPAPTISISPEIYYANDIVVGYTYNITLNGFANALRKELDSGSVTYGADQTIQHIGDIRDIFNINGGNLYIKQDNTDIIVAKGATIKSISFNPSENKWINYSPFTIELEFNEVDFTGCSDNPSSSCNSSFFNPNSITTNLIDFNTYKIKTFSDKWSFTIDNQIYDYYNNITVNNVFKVSYTLSATGKNYYIDGNLIPAWQQAKIFVQKRLHDQVMSLINGVLQIIPDNNDGCAATQELSELHSTDLSSPRSSGLFDGGNTLRDSNRKYDIYNETINCSTSEAEGTFSITYNATVKKNNPALTPEQNAVLHTFTKNISTTNNPKNVNITVQGNIQGLVRGGFIYYNNDFTLPDQGTFISTIDSMETKYSNALNFFTSQINNGSDLKNTIKSNLNITKKHLLVPCNDQDPSSTNLASPSSFTVDHSYLNGTIGYNATYTTRSSSTDSGQRGYSNVSIVRNDPVEIIQEFVIPGRLSGPIIQKLGMKTARTISINIDGASPKNQECFCTTNFNPCDTIPNFDIKDFDQLIAENENWIKTKEDYTSNKLDGSYSISLEYTCRG
jgi:hypothetical protein